MNTSKADINEAASLIASEMRRHSYEMGGTPSRDNPGCWLALSAFCNLRPFAVCDPKTTVGAMDHIQLGWIIVFNRSEPQDRLCRRLCHELAVYLLATLNTPHQPCHLRADDPPVCKWRHAVAQRVEEIVFRMSAEASPEDSNERDNISSEVYDSLKERDLTDTQRELLDIYRSQLELWHAQIKLADKQIELFRELTERQSDQQDAQ
jgi:hypothetical protein